MLVLLKKISNLSILRTRKKKSKIIPKDRKNMRQIKNIKK